MTSCSDNSPTSAAWLADNLACPRHRTPLRLEGEQWLCASGCGFPTVEGIPVLLLEEARQTMELAEVSLDLAAGQTADDPLYVESLGLSDDEKRGIRALAAKGDGAVDPVVAYLVAATNGIAWRDQVGALGEYPIPDPPLPDGRNAVLLDVGCSWGRWCIAAARRGYSVIGIDPSLGAVLAARRAARALGVEVTLMVGDARHLPIRSGVVDHAFSYSVIQHFSREDAAAAVAEMGRVLSVDGAATVQMPTRVGIRCLYHQLRRRFREGVDFEVRYWSLAELRRLFTERVGATAFSVDCYFGIGLQFADRRFMSPLLKAIVTLSEALRQASRFVPPLVWIADSVWVSSRKGDRSPGLPATHESRPDNVDGPSGRPQVEARTGDVDNDVPASFLVDGKPAKLSSFARPEMHLSSARATMNRHEFELRLAREWLVRTLASEYDEWVTESREDDELAGSPQDELAEAGYPPLERLVEDPVLCDLVVGDYLREPLFDALHSRALVVYWLDDFTSCTSDDHAVILRGICYSHPRN